MGTTRDIRAALEQRLDTVSGFPNSSNRHWENTRFKPTPGTTWAKLLLVPDTQRPAVRGPSPQIRYDGTFLIVIHYPEGLGAGLVDDMADDVRDAFTVDDVLSENSTNVRFEWSERDDGIIDEPWYIVTVSVKWYSYSSS